MANIPNIKRLKALLKDEGFMFNISNKYLEQPKNTKEITEITIVYPEYLNIKLPKKKPVTFEYILERFNSLSSKINKNNIDVFKKINTGGYHTSYGIGFCVMFGESKAFSDTVSFLESNGIEFKTEYSEARFTRRIKLSQSKENLNKIKEL